MQRLLRIEVATVGSNGMTYANILNIGFGIHGNMHRDTLQDPKVQNILEFSDGAKAFLIENAKVAFIIHESIPFATLGTSEGTAPELLKLLKMDYNIFPFNNELLHEVLVKVLADTVFWKDKSRGRLKVILQGMQHLINVGFKVTVYLH